MATEFVGIQLELMGADGVRRDLENLDKLLNSFRGKKKFDAGLNEAKNQVVAYRGELEKLQRLQKKIQKRVDKYGDEGISGKALEKNAEAIESVKNKLRDAQQAVREFGRASQQAGKTFMQSFKSISTTVAHVGSAMQSLGNALTRLTSPFSRFTTGILYGAGYKALNLFTEGLSGTFERADTMKLYPKMLQEFGFSAEESQKAISELEESVLGLPTGLDEIVAVQKRFVAASQDMNKSTGLAIAYNNAILASGSDARQQWTAQRILTQLAGGADIAATSWDALQRAIPLVFTELSKNAKMGVGDYVAALKTGKISTDEFMKDFIKIGGKGGSISAAAMVMTKSWQGLAANIQNATKRMGTAVLDALHEVFKDKTGRDLLDTLLGIDANGNRTNDGIRDWIDGLSQSIQEWIRANPDKIIDFFNDLKAIDIKGFLKGMAQSMKDLAVIFRFFAKMLGGRSMERLGRVIPWLNVAGKALTIVGGFFKGTRHIWALLGAGLLKVGKLAAGKFGKAGIFGKIASIFGKKKDIVDAGKAAGEVPTVASTFRGAFKALEGLIKAAGAVLIVGTTGMIAFKEVKEMLKDLKDIGKLLKDMTIIDVANAGEIAAVITAMTVALDYIGKTMGKDGILNEAIGSASVLLAGGTLTALTWEIKTALNEVKTTIDAFTDISNELSNFKAPEIDMKGIVLTILRINKIFSYLSGESLPQRGAVGSAGKALGFVSSPLKALGNSLLGGADKALKAKTVASRYKAVLSAIKSLKSVATQVNELATIEISDGAVSNVEKIANVTNQILNKSVLWMQKKSKGLKYLLTNTENFADTLIQLRRMAYHINALAGTNVNSGGFATFISQLKDALSELKNVQGDLELDVRVKLKKSFDKSVKDVKKKITDAKADIKKQAQKDISFSIPVSVRFAVSTNLSDAIASISSAVSHIKERIRAQSNINGNSRIHNATGGLIYRANGGSVPFKRRGTDTVPAMLTPGEYVHNKRAVNTFGIDFMRKVNSLDVKGAMNELMHRAGGMANVNRGTVITNNYNNNQKVTINNSNNAGAGFTFKSASRFVGAF